MFCGDQGGVSKPPQSWPRSWLVYRVIDAMGLSFSGVNSLALPVSAGVARLCVSVRFSSKTDIEI
jgi:hypothetical protein